MKTMRVRIAVAINEEGWCAVGSSLLAPHNSRHQAISGLRTMDLNCHVVWVEAVIPFPPEPLEEIVVRGKVKWGQDS